MLRTVLALVAGVLLAVAVVILVQFVGHQLYPAADRIELSDRATMAQQVAALPLGALLAVPLSWFAGSLCGGVLASIIDRGRPVIAAGGVAAFIMISAVYTLAVVPHPWWLAATGVAVIPFAAWLATRVSEVFAGVGAASNDNAPQPPFDN